MACLLSLNPVSFERFGTLQTWTFTVSVLASYYVSLLVCLTFGADWRKHHIILSVCSDNPKEL